VISQLRRAGGIYAVTLRDGTWFDQLDPAATLGFRVYGSWFRVWGLWLMVYGLWFRAQSLGIRDSGFGFRVSGFEFRDSGFGIRVSGFGFRDSGFGFQVSGFGFRVSTLTAPDCLDHASLNFATSHFPRFKLFPTYKTGAVQSTAVWVQGIRVQGSGFRVSGLDLDGAGLLGPRELELDGVWEE
jgi:hypothetical protein